MPLPPALAARLKKRGILPPSENRAQEENTTLDCEEEVIAEDYDEPGSKPINFSNKKLKAPVSGCPNKYNIYHDCSDYCRKRWGNGKENPSPTTQRKLQRLLKKYPLPDEWEQVWDAGVATYYFWNTITDEVSWLPPAHPKAKVSMCANKLRALMKEGEDTDKHTGFDDDNSVDDSESEEESDMSSFNDSDSGSESAEESSKKTKTSPPSSQRPSSTTSPRKPPPFQRDQDRKGKQRVKRNDLDPMDPASYSDTCPRGRWADGLEKPGDAKGGADETASGPLFQMRPYPSPGTVLKLNKQS